MPYILVSQEIKICFLDFVAAAKKGGIELGLDDILEQR